MGKNVSQEYLEGIADGRRAFKVDGMAYAAEYLENLTQTAALFDAQSPVGQLLRGERDFWRNQIKLHKREKP
jgi:hypothetical protein